MRIAGSTVLVTGASAGIGAGLATALAERGATVGIVGRRADRLAEVLSLCRATAPASRMWATDLGDVDGAAALAATAWDAFDGIDVLVNNAAIPKRRHVLDVQPAELDEVLRVNLVTPIRMASTLLPRMLERGRGMIVNVSSMGGRLGIVHETAYCASKFGLTGWTEAAAMDLWDTPVEVRLITPGPVDTEIWSRPDNDTADYDGELVPVATVANDIIAAIEGDRFETYTPDMSGVVSWKTSDVDGYLAAGAAMARAPGASTQGESP